MQHSHRYQHFALDASNNIVDIKNVHDDQQYFCPHCHKEMITKRGKIRQWHFAHKTDKCSYDKYLHSIAEIMIMDWFNKKETIMLFMDTPVKCNKFDSCIFYDERNCTGKKRTPFNLKKYYSKCIQEHGYKGFIADLYCECDTDPTSPIFIEIFVTHECSQEKIDSNIRIIELNIQSEEDILNIVNSSKLNENEMVRLYNFQRKESLVDKFTQPFQKYILYSSLKSYVERDTYTCKNYDQHRKGIYEISMPYDECIPYFINSGGFCEVGKVKAYLDGYLKKDCQICKWQATDFMGVRFCKLYKKCGNPKYCCDNNASKCSMFKVNTDTINDTISDFNEHLRNGNNVDIWKRK